jgi:ABC-type bacteriocin/lantibiotic exporter with double-glycine peptidase domain
MPMGLQTLVTEGGSTFSGGQQRLLIAAAIEAVSALDNRTQQIVSKSLENINATRIVIAHHLSTHHQRRYYSGYGKRTHRSARKLRQINA